MDVYQKHLLRLVVLHIIGTKLQAVVEYRKTPNNNVITCPMRHFTLLQYSLNSVLVIAIPLDALLSSP